MKAIKINQEVNLNNGLQIPSGSVVVVSEGYADCKSLKEDKIPAQVATFLYVSESAISDGKSPIMDVADFNPVFSGLELNVSDYETKTAESLLIDTVKAKLAEFYGEENLEVINL